MSQLPPPGWAPGMRQTREQKREDTLDAFEWALRKIHAGQGLPSELGLDSVVEGALYQYMMDKTPENLRDAQRALDLSLKGMNFDG